VSGHSNLRKKKKKSAPGWMIPAIIGGVLLLAGVIGAGIYFNTAGKAAPVADGAEAKKPGEPAANVPTITFTLLWLESERSGATLTINDERHEVPASGDVKVKLPLLKEKPYHFVMERKGYVKKEFTRPLTEDDSWIVSSWEAVNHGIEWEQDFDVAKKAAAEQHKSIFIVFDASDAKGSSAASQRFQESVALRSEFSERSNKSYICVYIDNPEKGEATAKVKDLDRNHKLTKKFRITVFPTVVVTDADARPYGIMENYKKNGVRAFFELLDRWEKDREPLFTLLERIKAEPNPDPDLLKKAISFLQIKDLDGIYQHTIQGWMAKLPASAFEVTQQEAQSWMYQFREAMSNPDEVKRIVDKFDRWKTNRKFKDPDIAAKLHLVAAYALARINLKAEAIQKVNEAKAFNPTDPETQEGIDEIMEIASGKPGEHHIRPRGSGSGFCIADGNYIMTNHHVIADAKKIMIHLEGEKTKYPAHLIADNEDGDMAVLKVDNLPAEKTLKPLPFIAEDAKIDDEVCAVGYPGDLANEVHANMTTGHISTYKNNFLVTDARADHGNSGGPLCSISGCCVVGMVSQGTAVYGDLHEAFGMAIRASDMKKFLKEKLPRDVLAKVPRQTSRSGIQFAEAAKTIRAAVVYVENQQ
jgi:S1-C subfamily serine protease